MHTNVIETVEIDYTKILIKKLSLGISAILAIQQLSKSSDNKERCELLYFETNIMK